MRTRTTAATVSLAASAVLVSSLALGLPASAADEAVLHISTNVGGSVSTATVTDTVPGVVSGTTQRSGTLLAAAPDGSGYVVRDAVAGTAKADVFVDGATEVATVLAPAPAGATYVVGGGQVVLRDGDDLALVDLADRSVDDLPGLPPADQGVRHVSAVAPAADGGVFVASVDADEASTTGGVHGADLWRVDAAEVAHVASFDGVYLPALARDGDALAGLAVASGSDGGSDASLVTVTDPAADALVSIDDVDLEFPADTIATELAFTSEGSPVAVVDAASGPQVRRLDDQVIHSAAAGTHLFVTPAGLPAPASVANPAPGKAAVSAVSSATHAYGAVVRPRAATTVTVNGAKVSVAAKLAVRVGTATKSITSGAAYTLTRNACFTASVVPAFYVAAAAPSTQCVRVEHRLTLASYAARSDVATIATTATRVSVQKLVRGAWRPAFTKAVRAGRVSFSMPAAKVRVLVAASASNAANSLVVTKR